MVKKLICPKCDYENREGTPKCLMCSTNLKGKKTVVTSFEESSDKQSTTTPNPIEATTEAVESEKEDGNLKELLEKPAGKSEEGGLGFGQKQRKKISPIRMIIYALLAAYWIWFAFQQCGAKETIS